MYPGRPGRGYDPTAGFTDLQWYFYHQRAVAYFGAFSTRAFDSPGLLDLARALLSAAPQFLQGFRHSGTDVPDAVLKRITSLEAVPDFDGIPDSMVGNVTHITDAADLPMLRIRVVQLAGGPDAEGRRSFVLVEVAHALTEGNDSAHLSRSRSIRHEPGALTAPPVPAGTALRGRITGYINALLHLAISRLWTPHPGALRSVSRAYPRQVLQRAAHDTGVSQRALFLALVSHTLTAAGTPWGKRISATYTTMAKGGGEHRDQFMRMRLRFASFENQPDLAAYARAVDERLKAPETGFEAEQKAASLRLHRRLARLMPFLYSPKFFGFWSYDVVFSLLTPHQLIGPLTQGMIEPIYCGAAIPGVNACFVVPGRDWVTFNFTVEAQKLPRIKHLDAALKDLEGPSLGERRSEADSLTELSEERHRPVQNSPQVGSTH
jgi:hypothetical protein